MVNTIGLFLQRTCPSSEMVMIDRTFNQEERTYLTQDKRMVLVDPGEEEHARTRLGLASGFLSINVISNLHINHFSCFVFRRIL